MNTSNENSENFKLSAPVPLDPIIIRARDEILEQYSDKSLEEQITFYKAIIEGEKDSVTRLSAMAARVYVLRKRLALLGGNSPEQNFDEESNIDLGVDLESVAIDSVDAKEPELIGDEGSWMRLKILDSSEVNGVRFPAGVVIDVKREDGEKLIEAKKAEFVSTEESRLFKSQEGLEDGQKEEIINQEETAKEKTAEVEVSDAADGSTEEQSAEAEVSDAVAEKKVDGNI